MTENDLVLALNKMEQRMAVLETHMETMAFNQVNMIEKFDSFNKGCVAKHMEMEHRVTSVEHKSGWYALAVSAIVGFLANIKNIFGGST